MGIVSDPGWTFAVWTWTVRNCDMSASNAGVRRALSLRCKPVRSIMKYRGVEYTVVQGIGHHVWKWSVTFDTGLSLGGLTAIKSEAVAEAERAINRALAPKKVKKVRLVPPGDRD